MILSGDWHLTDSPADEYRWKVFEHLRELSKRDEQLVVMGDLSDRKDRHSSILVNRIVEEFKRLSDALSNIFILIGNHDKPLSGPPFWKFLESIPNVTVVTQPRAEGKILMLPHAADPLAEWKGIPYSNYRCILMHQTVNGAIGDNGFVLQERKMPVFPRGVPVYSGDIHTPQQVGVVTYVGAPHPVKFGDDYPCRMLRIDEQSFKIVEEIKLRSTQKLMLDVRSIEELERISTHAGDQARIRFRLPFTQAERWPALQDAIQAWGALRGVVIASIEAAIEAPASDEQSEREALPAVYSPNPADILALFAEEEEVDGSMLEAGKALLTELTS